MSLTTAAASLRLIAQVGSLTRHSAIFMVHPHAHGSVCSSRRAACLRLPVRPCQSTPGGSVTVCHIAWPRHRTATKKGRIHLHSVTFISSQILPGNSGGPFHYLGRRG